MCGLSLEQELELLMSISETLDPWAQIDYSIFSRDELRMMEKCCEKEDRGEVLTKSEQKSMFEFQRKAEISVLK